MFVESLIFLNQALQTYDTGFEKKSNVYHLVCLPFLKCFRQNKSFSDYLVLFLSKQDFVSKNDIKYGGL